jgi:hypothetical protein
MSLHDSHNLIQVSGEGPVTWHFNMAHNLIEQIRDLAALIASMPPSLSYTTLRVAVVVGDSLPWRIVESIAISMRPGTYRRKMSYFRTAEEAERSVRERIEWRLADSRFARQHMNTPGDFPGITTDLVPQHLFDAMFGEARAKMRSAICTTLPERTASMP